MGETALRRISIQAHLLPGVLHLGRHYRLHEYDQSFCYLQAGAKYGCRAILIAFNQLPGLVILEVDVAIVGQGHDCIRGLLELILLESRCDRLPGLIDLGHDLGVYLPGGNPALKVLGGEGQSPVDEVAQSPHQLVVDLVRKDPPGEVNLLVVGGVAGQIIAQQIGVKAAIQVVVLDPDHISS